jgi:iron complex outermembrane receptor protein
MYNMRAIITTLLFSFCFLLSNAQSQKGTVTGSVQDLNGLPLSYVTVLLEGTSFGTVTNEQGNFILKAPIGSYTLMVKYIGYQENKLAITIGESKNAEIKIVLEDENNELGPVEVTGVKMKSASATRTVMELLDVPQAIVVLGQKTIDQQGAFDLTTIVRNMSGVNFNGNYAGAGSYQFFNARGFDLSNSQNYRWNGMMIWNLGNNYSDNIEQVEFLKGPTSILFGDVAPGGIMNFVTKKPLADFTVDFDLKMGQWNLWRPALDISGPITKNKNLRYRFNTSYEKSNSFRKNVTYDRLVLAPTVAWDISSKLSLNVEAVFKKATSTDDPGLVSPDGTIAGLNALDPSLYLSETSHKYKFNDQSYFATLTYQLAKTWRIRAVGFAGSTRNRPFGIWPDQPDSLGNLARNEYGYYQKLKNYSSSLDIYGSLYTGAIKHNLLFGVEVQATKYRYTNEGYLSPFDTTNISNPNSTSSATVSPLNSPYLPFESQIQRTGFYFQDQIMFFNEKLHLLLGARAGQTKQGNHYFQDELAGTAYEGYTDDIVSINVITPRVGLVYKPKRNMSVYGSYSEGYEINSPDIFALNYLTYSTPPATSSNQVEVGAKMNLLKDKLGLSLSIFRINKKNPYGYVYLDPENPNYDEYNVYYDGFHRSQGIELDLDGKINKTLSLTAGFAFTDATIINDPGYASGNKLPNAPKYTGNIWLNYDPQKKLKGLTMGAGVYYKDKFFSGIDNNPDLQIPASYTIDVAMGYKYKQFGAQVNITNITNQINYANPWVFNLFEVRPLRRAVLTLTYNFQKKSR